MSHIERFYYDEEYISEENLDKLEGQLIRGGLFLVQLEEHPSIKEGKYGNGKYMVSIWVEDDGTWFKKLSFASYWMPDLLNVLSEIPKE